MAAIATPKKITTQERIQGIKYDLNIIYNDINIIIKTLTRIQDESYQQRLKLLAVHEKIVALSKEIY